MDASFDDLFEKARRAMREGLADHALVPATEAVKRNPGSWEARLLLAQIWVEHGGHARAIADARAALAIGAERVDAASLLAIHEVISRAALKISDPATAEESLRVLCASNVPAPAAQARLLGLLVDGGRVEAAHELASEVMRAGGPPSPKLTELALALAPPAAGGTRSPAEETKIQLLLGELFATAGLAEEATRRFQAVRAKDPDDERAAEGLRKLTDAAHAAMEESKPTEIFGALSIYFLMQIVSVGSGILFAIWTGMNVERIRSSGWNTLPFLAGSGFLVIYGIIIGFVRRSKQRRGVSSVLLCGACLVASAAAGSACSSRRPETKAAAAPIRLTVLAVNDFHGAIEERKLLVKTTGGATAEVRAGGAALLAAYVKKLRQGNPDGTLLLSGGDMWQGSLESNFFEGRPVVLLDNAMGYDAAALGNHEFDYGPPGPVSLAAPDDPPDLRFGALLDRQLEARFPFLAANVRAERPGVASFQSSVILRRKGVKIAIVGLATEDTPNTTQRPNIVGLAFDPPAPALVKAAREAREAGAEVVIVTAHLGGSCARGSDPLDSSSCKQDDEVMQVLRAIPKGTVDAFVAGHTHAYMAHVIEGVPVTESGAYGLAIGRIELELDPKTHAVLKSTVHPPTPVCRDILVETGSCVPRDVVKADIAPATFLGGLIGPDPEIERLLAPFRQEVAELKGEVLAEASRPMGVARLDASEMGALITDEMRAATRRAAEVPDADFAIQNSGGIRAPLPKGPITYGALYEVLPFDNFVATQPMTGEQLGRLFTAVYRSGRVMQTSGLKVEYCGEGAAGTAKVFDFTTGKPLVPAKTYLVAWNDFLANGGDGTKEVLEGAPASTVHAKLLLRDVVADGLRSRKIVNAEKDPLLDSKRPRVTRCKR